MRPPLDPHSEVVDQNRRWIPDWYSWLVELSGLVEPVAVTVASLPNAAKAGVGAKRFVTDATATTFFSVVAGGGANKVPVFSDPPNWRIG